MKRIADACRYLFDIEQRTVYTTLKLKTLFIDYSLGVMCIRHQFAKLGTYQVSVQSGFVLVFGNTAYRNPIVNYVIMAEHTRPAILTREEYVSIYSQLCNHARQQ